MITPHFNIRQFHRSVQYKENFVKQGEKSDYMHDVEWFHETFYAFSLSLVCV